MAQECPKCHGEGKVPLGTVAAMVPCARCGGAGVLVDDDLTPVESPEARRKSSSTLKAPVRCPKCKGDARTECDLCFSDLVGGCTRYIPEGKAIEWSLQHSDTDPVPKDSA